MVGQYLPFGILACEHVAGTVVGERRRARIRAHQTYDIPKSVARVNRTLAAWVGDFGEVAVGVITIQREFTCRVILLGHMVKTIDQITAAVPCRVDCANQILYAVPAVIALVTQPVYLANQITNFVIQVLLLVMRMPTCNGERLCFILKCGYGGLLKNVII